MSKEDASTHARGASQKMKPTARGKLSRELEMDIMNACEPYQKLTVRQLYYILVSRYGYRPSRRFYNLLIYHLSKLRRCDSELDAKFVDTTRPFISPSIFYGGIELWVEKDALRFVLEDVAMKYGVPIQVERGFASLSMFRDAALRARERGVREILYVGDFDPSGLCIQRVNFREMRIKFRRIALTRSQIKKYNPPSKRVNPKDSRAPWYVRKYGERCWEVEALDPKVLLNIVESEFKKEVPPSFLRDAEISKRALDIAEKLTRPLMEKLSGEASELIRLGLSDEEVELRLSSKYNLAAASGGA